MTVAREVAEWVARDGWRLSGEWLIPTRPTAVAVVGHAMMVDRRTLDRPRGAGLVSHLVERGVALLWPDLRGHGASGPRAREGGDWGYDDLVADVPVLLEAARARFPDLPVLAVGHSLFGHVSLAHLARASDEGRPPGLDGLVMLACNVCNPSWRARPLWRWQKCLSIELVYRLARGVGRLPVERLGFGTDDEPLGYLDDFVRGARRLSWSARDGFDYYGALARVGTPVLALVGAGDRLLSTPEDAWALVAQLPRATFEVVGRRSGLPFDPGHMDLVLSQACRPVWDRIAHFVGSVRKAAR
jgi:predicted alpha/beta hydrolase